MYLFSNYEKKKRTHACLCIKNAIKTANTSRGHIPGHEVCVSSRCDHAHELFCLAIDT